MALYRWIYTFCLHCGERDILCQVFLYGEGVCGNAFFWIWKGLDLFVCPILVTLGQRSKYFSSSVRNCVELLTQHSKCFFFFFSPCTVDCCYSQIWCQFLHACCIWWDTAVFLKLILFWEGCVWSKLFSFANSLKKLHGYCAPAPMAKSWRTKNRIDSVNPCGWLLTLQRASRRISRIS